MFYFQSVRYLVGCKWGFDWQVWPWLNYPSYVYGGAYLVSRAAVGPLLAAAKMMPYFRLEDVYLVALCARKAAGVRIFTSDRIFSLNRRCSYNPFWAIKQVTWLTYGPEDMAAADRNVRKFYLLDEQLVMTADFFMPLTLMTNADFNAE